MISRQISSLMHKFMISANEIKNLENKENKKGEFILF
jgi:hypothetical protein